MIRSLDSSTIRRITSGQVITKVEDVVKELVENSIDAESTSIEVKLVGDGLTSITVKDNGIGILECDRPAMALRSHTSKLYDFEGLSRVETYGFRGEALNSICAVTESTQITTKTENDQVAILYILDRSGKILHTKSSGSSPGTTVTAIKLFSNFPVRRQVAKKNSSTIGKNVQSILTTYALAHPHIRFSLKQTYENNSKLKYKEGDWIQPAMKNTMDAIIKLFGSELSNEVQFGVWSSNPEYIENSGNIDVDNNNIQREQEQCIVTLEAVLPKPDADPHIIFKNGKTFIYVNNRPVITTRGEIKNLVSMVKSVYNEIACQNGWLGSPKTPFMWINIKLPTWSYDINVEPSKNVALFHHGEILIETISNLLEMLYNLNNEQEQDISIAMEVDQPVESIIDDDNVNSNGNGCVEEITMDPLERAPIKTFDNTTPESCTPSSASKLYTYNIRPDNLSERDDQVLYSPSRSEFSYIHSQRVSGTTTPIHDREIAEMLIMDSDSRMERTSSNTSTDIRQYVRQGIHPASKQKMYDDESRKRHNITKRHDRVQHNNKDGTIDNWLRNCQTQNVDVPPYPDPQIINSANDDEQRKDNFAQSPSRNNSDASRHSNTELPSHHSLKSGDPLIPRDSYNQSTSRNYNRVGDIDNKLSPRRTGDLLLTPPNDKSTFDMGIQRESLAIHANDLHENLHNDGVKSRNFNEGVQSKNGAMPFVVDDIAESMHKRPRIDGHMEDLNQFEDHGFANSSSSLDVNKDNIVQSETESNQLNNNSDGSLSTLTSHQQQLQSKEIGVRTIAIGQPTIDDLLKSGTINILDNNNNKVATNVNVQSQSGQHPKKKSVNDNRLAVSLTDVLNQELKLKFDKLRIIRRNGTAFKCSQIGYSLSCFNKLDYGMWAVTRRFIGKVADILIVHGERIRELVTLETLVTSTELNPTRKLLNPIDVTIDQLGPVRAVECLKCFTFEQIPDENGAGIWWNMVTRKCLTANGIKVRWREDHNGQIYIQITHISPLVQFATAVEYFAHLMKHLCNLNVDSSKDIPFINTRSRLTMQILAREARQMVKHEDWTINKRDEEMKQRVKDATTYLLDRMQNFGCNSSVGEDNENDKLTPLIMVKRKNDEIWYNDEMVVKILWRNIEEQHSQ